MSVPHSPTTVASAFAFSGIATGGTYIPPASLYVGDLHPDVTDATLFDAFADFKSLTSVRVCRDSSSGRSLCYGYVNFVNPNDATNALEAKNHAILLGKAIRVAWSCRDPDARRTGRGNIFVKNLSDSVDYAGLHEMFKPFGSILSCKVVMSEDGKSKGYGFVQFDTEESAEAAIEKLNGSMQGEKHLYVAKFVKRSDRVISEVNTKYTNLYLKNLDPNLSEETLREKFSEFGKITSLIIKHDDVKSRSFGFVNFDNPDDAKRATEAMNGLKLGSEILYVARAQKRSERNEILRREFEDRRKESIQRFKDSNVYIKNINDDVTDEELKEHFSQCGGDITSAKIMRDDKGISKGFGFVCFSEPEDASRAVKSFHGFMFHGKPLYVAIAQRKEDRLAKLQVQYSQRELALPGASPAVIPGGYPSYYYAGPSGLISQGPAHPGLMYQPIGLRPAWRGNGIPPPNGPGFPTPISRTPRDGRHSRGRMNGHMIPQGGVPSATYIPHLQQPTQPVPPLKDFHHQHGGQHRYVPNGRPRDTSKVSGAPPYGPDSARARPQGSEMLSSMLAAAGPEQQKQILGEHLYPLVQLHKPDLVAKITGMLLEMDNSELLLLLESPESLATKVEEAVQVLKLSQNKPSSQGGALQPNFLSAEVAVN